MPKEHTLVRMDEEAHAQTSNLAKKHKKKHLVDTVGVGAHSRDVLAQETQRLPRSLLTLDVQNLS